MSLSMHFFKVPTNVLEARGFQNPRLEDTKFLETIITQEEMGHLQSAWGIHIWLLVNMPTTPRRGDPFRLNKDMVLALKEKLETAMKDADIQYVEHEPNEHNRIVEYKSSWKANKPEELKKHFPYTFENIVAGDVAEGLGIANRILDETNFNTDQIWYYPLY